MNKIWVAFGVAAAVSSGAIAGVGDLPPEVEAAYQVKAQDFYETTVRACQPLAATDYMFKNCQAGAVRSRDIYMANSRALYWSAQVQQNTKKAFAETVASCAGDTSSNCVMQVQDAAEDYGRASMNAMRAGEVQ
jgi:hypothetical protein